MDSFRASSDYLHLVGGQFATHPGREPCERRGGQEDNFLPHTVTVTDLGREHPITAGIDDFDLVTEQYWVLHDDLIDVLATTTHPTRAVASVAPAGHLAGDLDPAVGRRADRRDDPRAQPRRAGAPERPDRHREGDAVGDPHGVGIVGLGVISRAYLDTLVGHPEVRVVAVADLDAARSAAARPPTSPAPRR